MNVLRSAVRPLVTFGFVAAQIGLAIGWAVDGHESYEKAFAALAVFTGMIVRDYFSSREQQGPPTP